MRSKRARLKDKMDRLIQEIYVPRNPRCLVCGNPTSEMHHYIQKNRSLYLRWDERNLIPLCRPCHYKHNLGDPEIVRTILKVKGEAWAEEMRLDKRKLLKDTISNLEEILNKLEKK